jgi:haloalkane dehalogenase
MELLRTPDERFADLAGYPFDPRYTELDGIRVHHLDEGSGPPVLLMHGEPSWSYLYRTMVPPLVAAGFRVVAPDLVGFGRSDKPAAVDDHTYGRHVDWMLGWLRAVDLDGVTMFCQDWGGLIGLRLMATDPDRFARVAVANTGLPTGDQRVPEAFAAWREYARSVAEFPVGGIVQGATVSVLPDQVVAGYDAPFPDESYKAGPRAMPSLVPIRPDDPASEPNREAWRVLAAWDRPFLTLFSDSDPITAGGERVFHKLVPGCAGQPHATIAGGGHFLQEDRGPEIATILVNWARA